MVQQRIDKSSLWSPPSQAKPAQFDPVRAKQDSHTPPTSEALENATFNQNQWEALGLQLKQESGAIAPVEQERLGVLQAKMADFWAQRQEKGSRFSHNFAKIPLHAPSKPTSAPVPPQRAIRPHIAPETQSTLNTVRLIQAKGGKNPATAAAQRLNPTGLPDRLKSSIESLSGFNLDDVNVHYNSSQPAQLNALAYTQGTDIHVAPRQERHLPHEAWHVVQQAQGRVKPTLQLKDGVPVNDDEGLEHEADVMGAKALQMQRPQQETTGTVQELTPEIWHQPGNNPIQLKPVDLDGKKVEPANLPLPVLLKILDTRNDLSQETREEFQSAAMKKVLIDPQPNLFPTYKLVLGQDALEAIESARKLNKPADKNEKTPESVSTAPLLLTYGTWHLRQSFKTWCKDDVRADQIFDAVGESVDSAKEMFKVIDEAKVYSDTIITELGKQGRGKDALTLRALLLRVIAPLVPDGRKWMVSAISKDYEYAVLDGDPQYSKGRVKLRNNQTAEECWYSIPDKEFISEKEFDTYVEGLRENIRSERLGSKKSKKGRVWDEFDNDKGLDILLKTMAVGGTGQRRAKYTDDELAKLRESRAVTVSFSADKNKATNLYPSPDAELEAVKQSLRGALSSSSAGRGAMFRAGQPNV
ncbi:MAG TPA: DUF4157 domain-containing protein, partial [Coleofasciculaceae cyanobacterium]